MFTSSRPPTGPSFVPLPRDVRDAINSSASMQLDNIGKQRTKEIRPGTELRITVSPEDDLYLRAHSRIPDTFATAEIFGMELVMGHEYKVERGTSIAIFSWHGCTIEMRGPTLIEYDASNHVMRDYVNLAAVVEQKRQRAEEQHLAPPRVLVTGSSHSGKSTLGLFLSNYALRKHRRPIYVELDPASLSAHRQLPAVPGTVTALHLDHSAYELNQEPIHPQRLNLHKGIDQGTAAAHLNLNYPVGKAISFWFGYEDWRQNPIVFWKCMAQLSCLVLAREEVGEVQAGSSGGVQADGAKLENPSKGGLIVNAPKDATSELLDEIVKMFKINTIAVIDDDEKYMHFINKWCDGRVPNEHDDDEENEGGNALIFLDKTDGINDQNEEGGEIEVVHLAKAGAVIAAQLEEDRNRLSHMKFADYFHGPDRDLVCHNFTLPFRELFIGKIVPNLEAGGASWRSRFKIEPLQDIPGKLRHSVLAVALAPTHEDVVMATITGLVWIREVSDPEDPLNALLHIMCPSSGPLVSNYLLLGDLERLKYYE